MSTSNWMGALGVLLILLAYCGNTFRLLSSKSRLFFAINAVGAGLVCVASFMIAQWPVAVLKGVWALVSVIGLIRVTSANRR